MYNIELVFCSISVLPRQPTPQYIIQFHKQPDKKTHNDDLGNANTTRRIYPPGFTHRDLFTDTRPRTSPNRSAGPPPQPLRTPPPNPSDNRPSNSRVGSRRTRALYGYAALPPPNMATSRVSRFRVLNREPPAIFVRTSANGAPTRFEPKLSGPGLREAKRFVCSRWTLGIVVFE